jgi:putative photosynthetic complex assembly protein
MATQPRPAHPDDIPRGLLVAIAALLLFTLAGVSLVRLTGGPEAREPSSPAMAARELRFADRPDGGIVVSDARTGEVVRLIEPETNGFLRGTMRSLVRDRRRDGIGAEPPFVLAARADGRLTIDDPSTGRTIDLASFGPTNASAFAQLLAPADAPDSRLPEPTR